MASKMNRFPKVSVIIATYNRPQTLLEAVQSVCSQTYDSWECVVVNDGGTNVRLALEGLHDERIKCFDKQHAGYPAAANLGLSIARGEYVSYLGDDDRWYPNHLATCVDVLDRDHNIGLVYTKQLRRSFVWRERQRVIVEDYLEPLSEFNWAKLLDVNWIPMTSVVHRSQLIEQCGPFKDLPILEDWELLLRLCSITQVAHIPIVTGEYYFDPTGESRNEKMKKENPKKSRKIIEDIRNSHRSRDVREAERPPDYFPERFVLSTLFAGQGSIGVALRMASNLYLYSRYWGRKAAFKKMWRRLLQSFQKN